MGFFFSLLYITTAYATPTLLFGPLAPFHIEVILAVLALLFSIPNIPSSNLARLPQTYAMLALCVAVSLSFIGNGYFGGAPPALYDFSTAAMAYFLTVVNVRKVGHLQLLVAGMLAASVFFIIRGAQDVYHHVIPSMYVYGAEVLPRIRGLGIVNDPNDFSQVLVTLIPLVFLWKKKSLLANVFLVGLPIASLITGMYLTHSRGSIVALMVVIFVVVRKKVGSVPAAVLGAILFTGGLAMGWSGGRDVSMEAGADRLDAWSVGIGFIKSHPLFGVGDHRFADFNNITAHNSIIVCAAEIGLPGFFAWVLFIFATYRLGLLPAAVEGDPEALPKSTDGGPPSAMDLWQKKSAPAREPEPAQTAAPVAVLAATPPGWVAAVPVGENIEGAIDPAELRRIARLLMIAITGFLAAGWFLSRALSTWLFMYCGMLCATAEMAARNGIPLRRDSVGYLMKWSVIIAVGLILFVYVLLRVRTILGK